MTTPDPSAPDAGNDSLLAVAQDIRQELRRLNAHQLITAYDSTRRLLVLQFLKGTAFGLGSVLGASIVLSAIVYLLSQIEFVPIIGQWVKAILHQVQQ